MYYIPSLFYAIYTATDMTPSIQEAINKYLLIPAPVRTLLQAPLLFSSFLTNLPFQSLLNLRYIVARLVY